MEFMIFNVSFTGLAGKAEFERAKINELIDFQKDVAAALGPYIYVKRGFREGDVVSFHKSALCNGD
jgi:hypothetical protein